MNVNREIIENSLRESIKFVSPVSLFGNPLERDFYKLKNRGIRIIEDAATNLGTKIKNEFVGSLADITCFSFHPRKIITTGEGGMITTNNKKLNEKIRIFKTFGKNGLKFNEFGTNYKLSDIQSAVGIAQLAKIEKIIKKRKEKAKIYDELFSKNNFIEIQKAPKNSRHTYQSYVCYFSKQGLRNKIMKKLQQVNVETQIGTYALHCLPVFKHCLKEGKLSNSEFLYKNSMSLPLHEELSNNDQALIAKTIQESTG